MATRAPSTRPTAWIELRWSEITKRWTVVGRRQDPAGDPETVRWLSVETSVGMHDDVVALITEAVAAALEGFLPW